jgi:hypothetical protein
MVAALSYNPYQVTVAQGMFSVHTIGLKQGTAYPDPAIRNALRGGWLDTAETLPMWGGAGIYMDIPGGTGQPHLSFQTKMGRATALTGAKPLNGFSVFDQNYSMVTTPQNTVPIAVSGQSVHAYAMGSRARIAVAADPSIAAPLYGLPINSQVSWDFVNQMLVPYIAAALTVTSGTYVPATGLITLTMSAPVTFGPGPAVTLSALTGTGAFAALNGSWTAIAPTSGTTVTLQGPIGGAAATITGGSAVLGSGAGSVLPVTVLEVQTTNCITVAWDSVNQVAKWNFGGCCAVIQI